MTSAQLKAQIDAAITNKVAADSITPTDVGNNLKDIVDYVDQQVATGAIDADVVHKTGLETITGTKTFITQLGTNAIEIANDFAGYGILINQTGTGRGMSIATEDTARGIYFEMLGTSRAIEINNLATNQNAIRIDQTGFEAAIVVDNDQFSTGFVAISTDGDGVNLISNGVGRGISIVNSGAGPAIELSNGGSSAGILLSNISTGTGIDLFNTGVNNGMLVTNTGNGTGIHINPTGNGSGLVIDNDGTNSALLIQGNTGIIVANEGFGISIPGTATSGLRLSVTTNSPQNACEFTSQSAGISVLSQITSTGNAFEANAVTPEATGRLFSGKNQGTEICYITKTGSFNGTGFNITAMQSEPASAVDTGTLGEIRVTPNYIYICTALNTWKRVPIATF